MEAGSKRRQDDQKFWANLHGAKMKNTTRSRDPDDIFKKLPSKKDKAGRGESIYL